MKQIAIALSAAVLPFAAIAQPYGPSSAPGYTYIQGDYLADGDMRGVGRDTHGYAVEGSADIAPNVFVSGRYDRLISDGANRNVNRYSLGVGLHDFFDYGGPRGTGMGYYASLSYERLGLRDFAGVRDATGSGYGLNAGLRWLVDPKIELNPGIGYVDFASISGDHLDYGSPSGWRYGMRLLAHVTQDLALSTAYARTDYDIGPRRIDFNNEIRVGARLTF